MELVINVGKRGPKPKPEEEKYRQMLVRLPPDLYAEVQEHLKAGERSKIVQDCLRRAVARAKREKGGPDA